MRSAFDDLFRILTLADESLDRYQVFGYRWDRLTLAIAMVASIGTAGFAAAQPLASDVAAVGLADFAGVVRYLGTGLQLFSIFCVSLFFVVVFGTEVVHRMGRYMGLNHPRSAVAAAFAISLSPIAIRSLIVGVALTMGSSGFPVLPWTLIDPTPAWSGYLLARSLNGIVLPKLARAAGIATAVLGYLALGFLGASLT